LIFPGPDGRVCALSIKGQAMPFKPASRALSRFTVLDLTRVRSGPTCVRQLADWGANVIKIETPEGLEKGDAPGGPRHGSDFQNLHRNKRSLSLNLKTAAGLDVMKRLVAKADVLVENYRPDVKHRLGIDYETLKAVNPRLVYASISGFGQDGPYRERPGFDQIAQGMGGLMSITGLPGQGRCGSASRSPTFPPGSTARSASWSRSWPATRPARASGSRPRSCRRRSPCSTSRRRAGSWTSTSRSRPATTIRPRSRPASSPPPTGTSTSRSRARRSGSASARAIGREDLLSHPDYASAALRSKNRDALGTAINAALASQPSQVWIDRFNEAGVPCGPINAIDEVFADPQVRHLGIAQSVASPKLGDITLVGQPVRLSDTPSALVAPPPENGEHTDEILSEFGYAATRSPPFRRDGTV
jgi:formyl-CoA transferase